MGKIIKFLLKAVLFLFLLGVAIEGIKQFGGILIAIAAVVVVVSVAVAGKSSNQPEKKAEDDKIEKIHLDIED